MKWAVTDVTGSARRNPGCSYTGNRHGIPLLTKNVWSVGTRRYENAASPALAKSKSPRSEFHRDQTIKTIVFWCVIMISAFLLWQLVKGGQNQQKTPEISYSQFLTQVESGSVAKVTIYGSVVKGTYRDGSSFQVTAPASQDAMVQTLRQKNVEVWFK